MTTGLPVCAYCKHLYFDDNGKTTGTCDAFPGGIPSEIILLENDHSKPVKGDHGIQFESTDKNDLRESNA